MSFKLQTIKFGNDPKERLFKPQWYQKYPWLHYDVTLDKVFCHTCIKTIKLGKLSATKSEEAFTNTGFQNWKKGLQKKFWISKTYSNSHKKTSEYLMKAADYGANAVGEL